MSDVFISYSRLDRDFAVSLHDAFVAQDHDIWIDKEDIPPSQEWWSEIQKGIANANNFVVILSPNSMASPICHMEIEYARKLGKRIIPVMHMNFDRIAAIGSIATRLANPDQGATRDLWGMRQPHFLFDENSNALDDINYFFFGPDDEFQARFTKLYETITTDYTHKEQHTTLTLRASEWDRRDRNSSFLLLDDELAGAQEWLQSALGKTPAPTPLQEEYIAASEKRTRQLRRIRRTSVIGSLVAVFACLFSIFAVYVGGDAVNRMEAANATLTPIPATLTQAAVINQGAFEEQQIAYPMAEALLKVDTNPEGSLITMNYLVEDYPQRASVYIGRGIVFDALGRYEEALADYDQAAEREPENPAIYLNRGNTYMNMGENDQAIENFTRAIELNPIYVDAYNNRGIVYFNMDDYDHAIENYTQAIELYPDYANAYFNRGLTYLNADEPELALADLEEAALYFVDDPDTFLNRGLAHERLEQYDEAIADYSYAIELNPEFAQAYVNRGNVYTVIGDTDAVLADWNMAESLGFELSQEQLDWREAIIG
jgi:tetratricopeptide (TPR) repeat protein